MLKDFDKYLTKTVQVYLFVLIIIFIMKLVGLDYFGLTLDDPIMIKLEKLFSNFYAKDTIYFLLIITYQYLMLSIIFKDNSYNYKKFTIITIPITCIIQMISAKIVIYHNFLSVCLEFIYLFAISYIYNLKRKKYETKKFLKNFTIVVVLNMLFQILSMLTRFKYSIEYVNEFIPTMILNLDYLLLLLITQKLVIINKEKGDKKICLKDQVGSSSQNKLNLKKLPKKLQKNWHNFKKLEKVEKLTAIIYFILSLIWNVFSVVLVLFVAFLNNTLVECIFILTSFWLSKRSFGKSFHFSSMSLCFVVSNLSYYLLNRLTTPLGISIIIPILLGVGLSYFTSKLVKKTYKQLYRGMPEELFEETILKVTDKNSLKYKICYDFYINNKSIVSLALKYNYTESGIRKIKDRINDKIKRLN